tara:strand:+ start:52 stop:639 length:588 start_codon:yes stop_codon:yes gene_type:complete
MSHYKPNIWSLIKELFNVIFSLIKAPCVSFPEDSLVVIMDPIDAYANLYRKRHIENINKLIDIATKKDIPIVLTRWNRTRTSHPIDQIDLKGHWTFFIPHNQTKIMKSVKSGTKTINVIHTNAFMHPEFQEMAINKKHLIIAGAWLESCIINTTRCALDHNISVSVVGNASTGHFPFNVISMIDIQSVYGSVVNI